MQDDAADQLDVEVAHVQDAAAGFADDGEGFDQDVVEGGALGEFLLEFNGLRGQFGVGELLDGGFALVDGGDERPNPLDLALVLGAEDFGQKGINHAASGGYTLILPYLGRRP